MNLIEFVGDHPGTTVLVLLGLKGLWWLGVFTLAQNVISALGRR